MARPDCLQCPAFHTHLCPFSKSKVNLYEAQSLTASTLLHRLVLSIELVTVLNGTGKVDRLGNSNVLRLPVIIGQFDLPHYSFLFFLGKYRYTPGAVLSLSQQALTFDHNLIYSNDTFLFAFLFTFFGKHLYKE